MPRHEAMHRVVIRKDGKGRTTHGVYGSRRWVSAETAARSRFSEPVYYVFDNRGR